MHSKAYANNQDCLLSWKERHLLLSAPAHSERLDLEGAETQLDGAVSDVQCLLFIRDFEEIAGHTRPHRTGEGQGGANGLRAPVSLPFAFTAQVLTA